MEYVFIQNYAKRGQLAISTHVFDEIISVAMSRVKGAKLNKKANDKFLFLLHKPVHCEIKNGFITADLQVIVSSTANVNDICVKIQEEVSDALTSMTEFIPFSINVKVVGIE